MVEVTKEIKEYLNFRRKLIILEFAKELKNNIKAIREFNIPKSTFYNGRKHLKKKNQMD